MKHKSSNYLLSFIDLLFNMLAAIVITTMISLPLIAIKSKTPDANIKKFAEAVITIEWSNNIDCDVDLWVKNPNGEYASFKSKDSDYMHIERDDMGYSNDAGGKENKEYWTLRGILAGTYTVNLHLYSCNDEQHSKMKIGEYKTVDVEVQLMKLNPAYQVLNKKIVTLNRIWEEKTVYSFILADDGTFSNFDETPISIIQIETQK